MVPYILSNCSLMMQLRLVSEARTKGKEEQTSQINFNSIALLQILNGSLQVGYFRIFKSVSDFVVLPFTMYLFTNVLRLSI